MEDATPAVPLSARAATQSKPAAIPCAWCLTLFLPPRKDSRYCCATCGRLARRNSPNQKKCSASGCNSPVRARGVCVSHYAKMMPRRMVTRECWVCGRVVQRRAYLDHVVCSEQCRYYARFGVAYADKRQIVGPIQRPPRLTDPPVTSVPSSSTVFVSTRCAECGLYFIDFVAGRNRRLSLCCSRSCTKRRRRRDNEKHWISAADRLAIYLRDQWTCQLCRKSVDPLLKTGDWIASLDHVIPRSKGGTHTADNLRLAHRFCNSVRRAGDVPDWWFTSATTYPQG